MIEIKQIISGDDLHLKPTVVKDVKKIRESNPNHGQPFYKTPASPNNYKDIPDGRLAKVLTEITEEERETAEFEAKEYTYKVLNYAEKDDITPEVLRQLKAFHHFAKHGVKTGYSVRRDNKLLSADIFYILLSEIPVIRLAEIFNVSKALISEIKRGLHPSYRYEHTLVKNIRSIVAKNLRRATDNGTKRVPTSIFRLCKMTGDKTFEILYHCKSRQVACGIRKSIITEKEWKSLNKKKMLEVKFPIQEIPLAT